MTSQPIYLGDGVYASFDGYQIQLHLGAHTKPPLIALEPDVFFTLRSYANKVWMLNDEQIREQGEEK